MYKPPLVIDPHDALQVTAVFAVNCCVCPCGVLAEAGVIVIGEVTFAVVEAVPVPLVAVAVTVQGPGSSGAVYSPPDVTLPQLAVKFAALVVVNCCVAPSVTVGLIGEIAKVPAVVVSEAKAVYAGDPVAIASILHVDPTAPLAV